MLIIHDFTLFLRTNLVIHFSLENQSLEFYIKNDLYLLFCILVDRINHLFICPKVISIQSQKRE